MKNSVFYFDSYAFDAATATLRLRYAYEEGAAFEEIIKFPMITRVLDDDDHAAIDRACRMIFLLAGVSYYKAYVPPRLECRAFTPDAEMAQFIQKVYERGLGEFSYQNKLDLRGRINIAHTTEPPSPPPALLLTRHLCVPVGGGKDSVVSIETLKRQPEPISLFVLTSPAGVADPIRECIRVAGCASVVVERQLSPTLIALNKEPGVYNGHVPITAILSAIGVLACLLQGWDTLVLSNEASASAPNLRYNDQEINHQYSKSFEFEKDFARYVRRHVAANFRYFSLLRPLSEPAITRRFAAYRDYHGVFRSCNAAFRQEAAARNRNWCGDCPKCRFVFLALAPFLLRVELEQIFGKNMLDDATQAAGFAALCGQGAHKPFECVGEVEESVLLVQKLADMDEWKNTAVIAQLAPQLPRPADFDTAFHALFSLKPDHAVPPDYMRLLA